LKSLPEKAILVESMENEPNSDKKTGTTWLKRIGVAGFLFFLIKGLIWLALIISATYFGCDFLK